MREPSCSWTFNVDMCPSHRVAEADAPRLPKANKALIEGVMDLK